MAETLDWIIVLIAGASLIFAFLAFRMVRRTSRTVDDFIARADKLMAKMKGQASKVFSPKFMADTLTEMITSGLKNEDGSQVTMPQYINGYVMAFGPMIYQDLKKEIPKYIPLIFNPPDHPTPGGPPNKGKQLADARWGSSGGLEAATKVGKAAKKVPMIAKVGEVIETGQALVGLVAPVKELIHEVKGIRGSGGGNGEQDDGASGKSSPPANWGPPL